jgi:hypothetical protein
MNSPDLSILEQLGYITERMFDADYALEVAQGKLKAELYAEEKILRAAPSSEDEITREIAKVINSSEFFTATTGMYSQGNTDIVIRYKLLKEHEFEYVGEAKIYYDIPYLVGGVFQLLGYLTGRHPNSFVLIYDRKEKCDTRFKEYISELTKISSVEEKSPALNREAETQHTHKSGARVVVNHYVGSFPGYTSSTEDAKEGKKLLADAKKPSS